MKNIDTSLLAIDIASVAFGYQALNTICQEPSTRVIEASVVGNGRFFILAQNERLKLEHSFQQVRAKLDGVQADQILDHDVIDLPESVLNAMYSLAQTSLSEALLVVECQSASGLIAVSNKLIHSHHLQPIEIKIHRGMGLGGFGFFTGSSQNCAPAAEDVRTQLRHDMRDGRVEVIDSPEPTFRRFFNLNGEA